MYGLRQDLLSKTEEKCDKAIKLGTGPACRVFRLCGFTGVGLYYESYKTQAVRLIILGPPVLERTVWNGVKLLRDPSHHSSGVIRQHTRRGYQRQSCSRENEAR